MKALFLISTCAKLIFIWTMKPRQLVLNKIDILNIIFDQILIVGTFVYCCLPSASQIELSTLK